MHHDLTLTRGATARMLWLALVTILLIVLAPGAMAQEEDSTVEGGEPAEAEAEAGIADETLILGAEVYSQTCSACHQPGGAGIEGQFPPLIGNSHVEDAEYMETVIRNGIEGELEVNGVIYDGRMPAFSTLPDEDIAAVIAYIQSGFASPAGPPAEPGTSDSDDGILPGGANSMKWIVIAVVFGVTLMVLSDRIFGKIDRLDMPWLDACLKTTVIVVWFVVFTVFVPSMVLQSDPVAKLSNIAQDLIGVSIWAVGLVLGLAGLWYAQRESRI